MECVTTSSMSLLVSRIPGEPFKPKREIRQGDPISSSIFIICKEYIGRYIYFMSNTPKSGVGVKVAKMPYHFLVNLCWWHDFL